MIEEPFISPPILFVHGNGDSSALWLTQIWRFESNGYPQDRLFTIDFTNPTARDDDLVPQPARSGSQEQCVQLAARVDEILTNTGATKLVLIGSSRGGYAIRNFLKNAGGTAKVSQAILCGTPNHGVFRLPGNTNEFNGLGPFLTSLNAGSEVPEGVTVMTIRSDKYDLYAQPELIELSPGTSSGISYDSPELKGAVNIVLDGLDHRETAFHPRAFAEIYRFITGRPPATVDIIPETAPHLSGRITGYEDHVPTNQGVAGVAVKVFEVDPRTGARCGAAVHEAITGNNGSWSGFTARQDAFYEFVVQAVGQPSRHFFRSPFPRSTPCVTMRLFEDEAVPGRAVIIIFRPRGYISTGRDPHLLDGKPVPGVKAGIPVAATFRVEVDGPERGMPVALNGEAMTVRAIPSAVVYAEFHY